MDSNAVCLHNATVYAGFSVMKNCAVYIKDGKIADVYNERRFKQKKFSPQVRIIDLMGASLLPGFIDTHIHGSGGYSTDDASPEAILKMSEFLAENGVTSFIPTINASPEPELMKKNESNFKKRWAKKKAPGFWECIWRGRFSPPNASADSWPKAYLPSIWII